MPKITINLKSMSHLERIFLGFFLFYLSNSIADIYSIPKTFTKSISLIGLFLILQGFIKVKKTFKYPPILQIWLKIYIAYSSVIGFLMLYGFLQKTAWYTLLLNDAVWVYFLPFLTTVDFSIYQWKKIAYKYAWLSLIYSFIFCIANYQALFINNATIDNINNDSISQSINIAILPLTYIIPIFAFWNHAIKEKKIFKFILYTTLIISIYSSIISGKRTGFYICMFYMIAFIWIYVQSSSRGCFTKIIFLFIIILTANYIYQSSIFDYLNSRIDIQNRDTLILDYNKSMELSNWLFGKGPGGGYLTYDFFAGKVINRTFIENAFLNMILKGGLFLLIPYLLLILKTALKLLQKNPHLNIYLIIYLIGNIFSMGSLMPQISLTYLILWGIISDTNSIHHLNIQTQNENNYSK